MELSDVAVVVVTVLVGFGAGVLSALLGVGGAVVTTPAVRVLGATPIQAVGSTVPAILPGAISGTLRYAKEGLVEWRVALSLGIAGSVFALAGALTSDLVDGRLLMVITAVLMLWSGISVARGGRRASRDAGSSPAEPDGVHEGVVEELLDGVDASETDTAMVVAPATSDESAAADPRRPLLLLAVVGAMSGFVAGLLGVGGGIVMVPVMTGPLRIPMRSAVASSLVAVAIFSVPALVTHALLGHINWIYALPLMVGVVPGARVGAHITIGASDRTIRLAFGVLIVVVALIYGGTEAAALF